MLLCKGVLQNAVSPIFLLSKGDSGIWKLDSALELKESNFV
jgi:hypothetical protein